MITKEQADIVWVQAQAIYQLVIAGFTEESARDAVTDSDLSKLKVDESGEKK